MKINFNHSSDSCPEATQSALDFVRRKWRFGWQWSGQPGRTRDRSQAELHRHRRRDRCWPADSDVPSIEWRERCSSRRQWGLCEFIVLERGSAMEYGSDVIHPRWHVEGRGYPTSDSNVGCLCIHRYHDRFLRETCISSRDRNTASSRVPIALSRIPREIHKGESLLRRRPCM